MADSTNADLTLRTAGEGSASAADLCLEAARTIHAHLIPFAALAAAPWPPKRAGALALPTHAFLSLCAAVEAFATVTLAGLQVDAPVIAAGPAFGAGAHLVVPPPYAVPRAALGVPATFPAQSPAIVGPGHPWY